MHLQQDGSKIDALPVPLQIVHLHLHHVETRLHAGKSAAKTLDPIRHPTLYWI